MAVRGLQHRNLCPNSVQAHNAVHPGALDRSRALQFKSEFYKELDGGRKVLNHDADVLHALDRHVLTSNVVRCFTTRKPFFDQTGDWKQQLSKPPHVRSFLGKER